MKTFKSEAVPFCSAELEIKRQHQGHHDKQLTKKEIEGAKRDDADAASVSNSETLLGGLFVLPFVL